ncbi:Major facilitator superfamily MFS_1 [Nocardioides sp. AX2bis]|nr:Major facilitator superfamily MFS_1 [Nocardioides sp. AX2bis]
MIGTEMSSEVGAPGRAGRTEWLGLAVLALPTIIIALDVTVLHLAAPVLARDLDPSPTQLLWIVDVYGFLIAGLLLTMGTLGDRTGRRRLLLVGAAVFGVVSVGAAFAPTPELLIAARALLGVAGATLMPSTLSLIRTMFEDPRERTTAIAVWMGSLGVGSAIGPLVGGVLLERFWWGSVFLMGVPVMVLLLLVGPFLLPEHTAVDPDPVDPASVVLSLGAVVPVVWAVKETAADGPSPAAAVALVVGVAAGVVFVRRQRGLRTPVLDVEMVSEAAFARAVVTHLGALFCFAGLQYLLLQLLQNGYGLGVLDAGLATLPAVALGLVGSVVAPWSVRRAQPATVVAAGLVVGLVGFAVIAATARGGEVAPLMAGFALAAFSVSVVTALCTDRMVGSAPPERAGSASGVSETAAELGIALGVALLGSLATAVRRADPSPAGYADGVVGAAVASMVVVAALLVVALLGKGPGRLSRPSSAAGSPGSARRRAWPGR